MMKYFLITTACVAIMLTATPVASEERLFSELPRTFALPSHVRVALSYNTLYCRERGVELYTSIVEYLTASVGAYTLATKLSPSNDPLAKEYSLMLRLTVPF